MFTYLPTSSGASESYGDAKLGGPRHEDLVLPRVAWPTLFVLFVVLALWVGGGWLAWNHLAPYWVTCAMAVLAGFLAFVPMHDSSHRSVAHAGWVNEIVGRLATVVLFAHYRSFRYLHMTHHKHTNEPGADPDYWSGAGPKWQLPIRWLTQDLHYYACYIRAKRPLDEVLEVCCTSALFVAIAIALFATGHGWFVLFQWLVPARLAIGILAFSFDYLPHQPHQIKQRVDRYRATHIYDSRVLTLIFCYQNYHLIHHLNPGVPFYRYRRVWKRQRQLIADKGAKIVALPV